MVTDYETQYSYDFERLLALCPRGTTVYTVLRYVSRSGMMRVISCYVPVKRDDTDALVIVRLDGMIATVVPGLSYNTKHEGISMSGAGMDMGFALVYDLSWHLYQDDDGTPDGYALRHEWL